MKVIQPTVGRRVWYYPNGNVGAMVLNSADPGQPCDAGIAFVWSDFLINISVADHNGEMHSRTSVPLLQEGDPTPAAGHYCTWMPYQVGQAKAAAPAA